MSGDVTKLPKWAQRRISTLERDNQALRDERRGNWSNDGDTEVAILNYPSADIPLPKRSRIVFSLGEGDEKLQAYVRESSPGERYLEVYGVGGRPIGVLPSSSNVVRIVSIR